MNETISALLLAWYDQNARTLPWRGIHDPYRTWVSETMLQQTRVETVRGYYERFLARFPDVAALAAAGMVLLMLPEFFFALFEKNGMNLETILTNFINVRFKRPAVRRYEIENLYEYEPEKPVTPKVKKGGIIGKRKG